MIEEEVPQGTIKKYEITISPIGNISLSQCDFKAMFFTFGNQPPLIIKKNEAIKSNDDSYKFVVDTSKVGLGKLECQFIVYIPDADVPGLIRPEIIIFNTQTKIVNSYFDELLKR